MRRLILLFVAFAAVSAASAQSVKGLFSGVSTIVERAKEGDVETIVEDIAEGAITEVIDNLTGGKATELLLVGDWSYTAPAMRITSGSDALSNVASSVVTQSVEGALAKAYSYIGITAGVSSFAFNEDNTFSAVLGKRTLSGSYSYDAATHKLSLEFSALRSLGKLNGYAYIDGEALELVFDCSKFMDLLTALGSKVSSLKSIAALAQRYDTMMIGFSYNRK